MIQKYKEEMSILEFQINPGQSDRLNCAIYDLLNDLVPFEWSFLSVGVILDWDMEHEEIAFRLINIDLPSVGGWKILLVVKYLLPWLCWVRFSYRCSSHCWRPKVSYSRYWWRSCCCRIPPTWWQNLTSSACHGAPAQAWEEEMINPCHINLSEKGNHNRILKTFIVVEHFIVKDRPFVCSCSQH